jgi:hypothetical protein
LEQQSEDKAVENAKKQIDEFEARAMQAQEVRQAQDERNKALEDDIKQIQEFEDNKRIAEYEARVQQARVRQAQIQQARVRQARQAQETQQALVRQARVRQAERNKVNYAFDVLVANIRTIQKDYNDLA